MNRLKSQIPHEDCPAIFAGNSITNDYKRDNPHPHIYQLRETNSWSTTQLAIVARCVVPRDRYTQTPGWLSVDEMGDVLCGFTTRVAGSRLRTFEEYIHFWILKSYGRINDAGCFPFFCSPKWKTAEYLA